MQGLAAVDFSYFCTFNAINPKCQTYLIWRRRKRREESVAKNFMGGMVTNNEWMSNGRFLTVSSIFFIIFPVLVTFTRALCCKQ